MTPTLLDIMGISTELPIFGRPLLSLPENEPGRAIMQYATTRALMVGDRVLVQQPEKPSEQFTYSDATSACTRRRLIRSLPRTPLPMRCCPVTSTAKSSSGFLKKTETPGNRQESAAAVCFPVKCPAHALPRKLGLEKYAPRAMIECIAQTTRCFPPFFIQHRESRYASNI